MRIPQKPKNVNEIMKKESSEVLKLLKDEEVMKFVAKCNKDYVHWDELIYKKIPRDSKP